MFRVHAHELRDTQQFLTSIFREPVWAGISSPPAIMHGLTKKATYVPGFSDQMKAELQIAKRGADETLCDRDPDPERCGLVGSGSGQASRR